MSTAAQRQAAKERGVKKAETAFWQRFEETNMKTACDLVRAGDLKSAALVLAGLQTVLERHPEALEV